MLLDTLAIGVLSERGEVEWKYEVTWDAWFTNSCAKCSARGHGEDIRCYPGEGVQGPSPEVEGDGDGCCEFGEGCETGVSGHWGAPAHRGVEQGRGGGRQSCKKSVISL